MRRTLAVLLVLTVLIPALPIFGVEVFEITGTVKDKAGNPIQNASVELYPQNFENAIKSSKTDAKGNFSIGDVLVASPRYMVKTSASGYFPAYAGRIGKENPYISITLDPVADEQAYRSKKMTIKMAYLDRVSNPSLPKSLPFDAPLDQIKYPQEVLPYLESGIGIEITPSIKDLARTILDQLQVADRKNLVKVAKAVYEWVVKNIEYDLVPNFKGDITGGNFQTTFGGFGRDFDDWCYTPDEVVNEKRAICIEFERLTSALLRALGVPARPTPLRAHPVTQFFVPDGKGSGFWSNMETSMGRNAYKKNGDLKANFPSKGDSEIAIIPTGPDAPIHMDWDFGAECWWREDYGEMEMLGDSDTDLADGQKALSDFEKMGNFNKKGKTPSKNDKSNYVIYARGFEVDMSNAKNAHPVVRFPEFLSNSFRETLQMQHYFSIPDVVETVYTETEKNEQTGQSQNWYCIKLDLTRIKQGSSTENTLKNGGFEEGLSYWEKQSASPNKEPQIELDEDIFKSGIASVRVTNTTGVAILKQQVQISGPKHIRVRGFVKCENVRDGCFIDVVTLAPGLQPKPPFPRCEPRLTGTADWREVSGEFDIGPDAKGISINLTMLGSGKAWFDDVEVIVEETIENTKQPTIEVEKNILQDGGFENVTNGDFNFWKVTQGKGRLSSDKQQPKQGLICSRLRNDNDELTFFSNEFEIEVSQDSPPYALTGFVKTKDIVKMANISLEITGQKSGKAGPKPGPNPPNPDPEQQNPQFFCKPEVKGTSDWTRVSTVVKLQKDTTKVRINCLVDGKGEAWFDEIAFGSIKPQVVEKTSTEFEEVWIENPLSKVKLCTHITKPKGFSAAKKYPTVIMLPGGNGFGTQLEEGGLPAKAAKEGFVVVVFDPDGRGKTKEGQDDISGPIHQEGLHAVLKFVAQLSYVDVNNIGLSTSSFGIILGACTVGRYPIDPPVKYILDWEGPDGHLCKKNHIGKFDMEFWAPREALDFIKKFPGNYCRIQSEKDHVQDTNDHAIRMINAATNTKYGGKGICNWTRVNFGEGDVVNKPNSVFENSQPEWISEAKERQDRDGMVIKLLKELSNQQNPYKDLIKSRLPVGLGRNRLGFLGPFGYPRYSEDLTKQYFEGLGVADEKELASKIREKMNVLRPTLNRENFFLFTDKPDWKEMSARLAEDQKRGIKHIVTLNFKRPGKDLEDARTVAEIVEYYDGDGDGDNPYGAVIKDWQIENEINMGNIFWEGTPQKYAKHLTICYNAAKIVDPLCNIIMAGEASDIPNETYPKIFEALDGRKYFDAVDIHVYGSAKDVDMVETCAARFRKYLTDAGFMGDTQMWMTEYGVYVKNQKNMPQSNETLQASTIAARTIIGAHLNLQGMCYIGMVDPFAGVNEEFFGSMGLLGNGSQGGKQAWKEKKSFWTFNLLSIYLSGVQFGTSEEIKIGEGIRMFKFLRPGENEIYFAFLTDEAKAGNFVMPVLEKMLVTPLVPKGEGDQYKNVADALQSFIVDPALDREKIADAITRGPIVIEPIRLPPLAKRIGACERVKSGADDSGFQYAKDIGISWIKLCDDAGLIWPEMERNDGTYDFANTDKLVTDATNTGADVILTVQPSGNVGKNNLETLRFARFVASVAERYDGDGFDDAIGSPVVFNFALKLDPQNKLQDKSDNEAVRYATILKTMYQGIKSANIRARVICGGGNFGEGDLLLWKSVFKALDDYKENEGYPFFDYFDTVNLISQASGKASYKFLQTMTIGIKKILDTAGLGNIPIVCTETGTYDGKPPIDEQTMGPQSEHDQAGELIRRVVTQLGQGSQMILWSNIVDSKPASDRMSKMLSSCGLVRSLSNQKKLSYYSMKKLIDELETIKFSIPGKMKAPETGLWGVRFGAEENPAVIAWVDGDNMPTFTTADFDMPNIDAIELTYLVPDGEMGKDFSDPIFKSIVLGRGVNGFPIPVDRKDPFIIRATDKKPSKVQIELDPSYLNLNPGQNGIVKVTVTGITNKIKILAPSTKLLPLKITPSEIGPGETATLTVSTDSLNRGLSYSVTVSAEGRDGTSAAELRIDVANTYMTPITLWIGKTEALVFGDPVTLKVAPTIIAGSTVVPIRFISEAFGAKVDYDPDEKRVDLTFGLKDDGNYTKKVTLWVGKKTARVDFGSMLPAFQEYDLSVAPVVIQGTTMVPIRFLSEVLGAEVDWNAKEKRIDIRFWQ